MKAIEFKSTLSDNKIEIPEHLTIQFNNSRGGTPVRVIVLIQEDDQNEINAYHKLSADQFLKGYDDSDAIYDSI